MSYYDPEEPPEYEDEACDALPCVFCGHDEASMQMIGVINNGLSHHVNCDQCDCSGPAGRDEKHAVELWNKRV